ncbi:ATP synthase subunit d mitochondrial [Spathaspora sp. JA1]|nr:ATP synthase subunit d mitochondrial [Spathaspora sp. JA1]
MSSVAKQAAKKVDFAKVINSLGLTGSTAASLTAFKKRHDEAVKQISSLSAQSTEVNFDQYRSVLKNSKVVDEIEKSVKAFKPVTIDVSKTLKNIEIFEQQAIVNAKETEEAVINEIQQLQVTLGEIEKARPFEQLTVDDVAKARPDLDEKVEYMVKNGKWEVPGYKEKFGDLSVM